MDSGNDFFPRDSHSLFWASKWAFFLGFVTFPELRAVTGIEGSSNEIVVFTLIQWSMLIKIVCLVCLARELPSFFFWYSQNHHPASVFTVHSVTMSHINDGHQLKTSSSAVFQNWGLALNSGKVVSRVPPSKTNVISSHCSFPGLRAVPSIPEIWPARYPLREKNCHLGGKNQKKLDALFFAALWYP